MRFPKRYLVTSALPYANGPLHIGHLTGAYISADIYVRFLRLMGKDVAFICGSDENGAAITMRAMKDGISPQEVVDTYHELFKIAFEKMGISFDIYHRTSDPLHHKTAQDFFTTLYEKGEFAEKESEQYFDEKSSQFLADRYIKGTCPKCGYEEAYGDQCENCGSTLSPIELINPVSTITGETPVLKNTKHWYLPLDKYESWLKEWINTGEVEGIELHDPNNWKNHVLGQCKSWLEQGLQPRAMTRDLDWGVDVPQTIDGAEGKKLYVWMDAPIGYISATKQWAKDHGKDWKDYWQSEDSALIHFIGKDNIVFHCLIFPAILKAHGGYVLPTNVPANQFLNLEGKKISTSRNWAVWVNEYIEDFPDKIDELRYYMIKNMPEQKDSEFTWNSFQDAVNNELVNNLANFVNRVIVLTNKFYKGLVPDFDEDQDFIGVTDQDFAGYHDTELLQLHDDLQELNEYIRKFEFRAALKQLMEISSKGNQLLQFNEPWKNFKTEPEQVHPVMNLALQFVTAISVAMEPFLPFAATKLRAMLNLKALKYDGDLDDIMFKLAEGEALIKAGHQIKPASHLFTRMEDSVVEEQMKKLIESSKEEINESTTPIKTEINFDDFTKLDLRTATILSAEAVPKANKLLKLELNLGFEKRTVVSGIAQQFTPEEIVGKTVVLLANLAPRKIRGVESKGMILMAENDEGKLSFISPPKGFGEGHGIS